MRLRPEVASDRDYSSDSRKRKGKGKKGDKKSKKDDRDATPGRFEGIITKAELREKKSKKKDKKTAGKPKYAGNYDVFIKKGKKK